MFEHLYGKFIYDVDRKNGIFAWRVIDELHLSEVVEIAEVIKEIILRMPVGKVKLLVDNRFMVDKKGHSIVFTNSINQLWIELQQWCVPYCSLVAVLCGTLVMDAQMKRLSQSSGLNQVLRSFYDKDPKKCLRYAYTFLGIVENRLVESPACYVGEINEGMPKGR